jgi:hypothetical protein
MLRSGNTKGGSITVPLTSCLTGSDWSVLQIKTKIVSCHTAVIQLIPNQSNRKSTVQNISPFSVPCLDHFHGWPCRPRGLNKDPTLWLNRGGPTPNFQIITV